MAKGKQSGSDAYIDGILQKLENKKRRDQYAQIAKAGKEFAIFCCWIQQLMGKQFEGIPEAIAELMANYPEAQREALGLYECLQGISTKGALCTFVPEVINGKLYIRFEWVKID